MSQSLVINTFCSFQSYVFMRLYKWGGLTFTWLLRGILVKQFSLLAFCTITPKHSIAGKAIICVDFFIVFYHLFSTSIGSFVPLLPSELGCLWIKELILCEDLGLVLQCHLWKSLSPSLAMFCFWALSIGSLFSAKCFTESLGSSCFICTIAKKVQVPFFCLLKETLETPSNA